MDNKLEQLKKDLVAEIKDLAQSLATAETFSGVLSNEVKFRAIQEKFIVLKFLEQKKLNLEVFDLPILTKKEKQEILKQEGLYEDEKPVVFDFEVKKDAEQNEIGNSSKKEITEAALDEEVEKVLEQAESLMAVNEYISPSSTEDKEDDSAFKENVTETKQEEEVQNKEWEQEISESLNYDSVQPEQRQPQHISLDFNDKVAFLNQLFLGDEESMNLVIDTLNRISDVRSSNQYLEDLKREMNWGAEKEEYFLRLRELVLKRFD